MGCSTSQPPPPVLGPGGIAVKTKEEVAKHKTAKSCWVIIRGRVYDVTKLIPVHPGGAAIIAKFGGGDASQAFHELQDHSVGAHEKLHSYHIGDLPETVAPVAAPSTAYAPPASETKHVLSTYRLTKQDLCTDETILLSFTAEPPPSGTLVPLKIKPGTHIVVCAPAGEGRAAAERPYTPIHSTDTTFDLLVKAYRGGLGSQYMHSLKPGDTMNIHGPHTTFDFTPIAQSEFKSIVMLAGGTGITPMYQVIRAVLESKEIATKPRLCLLWSTHTEADHWTLRTPLVALATEHSALFSVHFIASSTSGRLDAAIINDRAKDLPLPKLTLVCGPPSFINAMTATAGTLGAAVDKPENKLLVL